MVDDSVGGLFTMGDINSISESILSELKSKQSLPDKGIAGRRLVIDKFTFKKNANDFLKIYKKLIN